MKKLMNWIASFWMSVMLALRLGNVWPPQPPALEAQPPHVARRADAALSL
jgi:hypothetical protein